MPSLYQNEPGRVRRHPERARYDRETVRAVLDEGLVCHLGFIVDGTPFVMPTMYARSGDVLYVHGSPASRMLRTAAGEYDVCLTVTLVDGLVLARSVFHHSMNYRSVVVLGRAVAVAGDEKDRGLHAITEHLVPGRWAEARPPTPVELRKTSVLRLEIVEASAKRRAGGPIDDDDDLVLPVWARVLPCALAWDDPVGDPPVPP